MSVLYYFLHMDVWLRACYVTIVCQEKVFGFTGKGLLSWRDGTEPSGMYTGTAVAASWYTSIVDRFLNCLLMSIDDSLGIRLHFGEKDCKIENKVLLFQFGAVQSQSFYMELCHVPASLFLVALLTIGFDIPIPSFTKMEVTCSSSPVSLTGGRKREGGMRAQFPENSIVTRLFFEQHLQAFCRSALRLRIFIPSPCTTYLLIDLFLIFLWPKLK